MIVIWLAELVKLLKATILISIIVQLLTIGALGLAPNQAQPNHRIACHRLLKRSLDQTNSSTNSPNHHNSNAAKPLPESLHQRLASSIGSLRTDCAIQRAEQLEIARRRAEFAKAHQGQVHWSKPAPLRIPALCLMLWSLEEDKQDGNHLHLVNWYSVDGTWFGPPYEGATISSSHHSSRLVKRAATDHELASWDQKKAVNLGDNDNKNNHIDIDPTQAVSDLLFEPNNLDGGLLAKNKSNPESNHIEDETIERLLAAPNFQKAASHHKSQLATYLSPVILVPGLLGSRLEVRADKKRRVNFLCSKKKEWSDLWLNLGTMLPIAVDCWLDNARLELDPKTGWTRLPSGVETRVPDFGSVKSVEALDLSHVTSTEYFAQLISHYERLGYESDLNLLAAPYDFRLSPQELEESGWYSQLRALIEQAKGKPMATKRPVTLICHSMGCTHLLVFLRKQPLAWRQAHIRKLIAISSPWGGASKALKVVVTGDSMGLPLINEQKVRKLARTFPSSAFLLPHPEVFGVSQETTASSQGLSLVQVGNITYQANQLRQLMLAMGQNQLVTWLDATQYLIKPFEPVEGLRVDCIHGDNVPTPQTIIFRSASDFPDGPYELVEGPGDGTVNRRSLQVCQDWALSHPDLVTYKLVPNTDHSQILSHPETFSHLSKDVFLGFDS